MKTLITGHLGFIGRHFYKELCLRGYDVVAIDICGGNSCEEFFKEDTRVFDFVFHFACYVEPMIVVKNIKTTNISYDIHLDSLLFSWAVRTQQKNIVYFSSSSVYPISLQNDKGYKLKESDVDPNFDIIKKPDNLYGWTKLTGEVFLEYLKSNGVNSFIFRPFSVYGEDQNSTFVFKSFLNSIERKDNILYIWGDGEQTRDFVYIDDVVNAVFKVIDSGYNKPINIGTGIPTSMNNLMEIMLQESHWKPLKIIHILGQKIGEKYRCADMSILEEIYNPQHSIRSVVKEYFKRGI